MASSFTDAADAPACCSIGTPSRQTSRTPVVWAPAKETSTTSGPPETTVNRCPGAGAALVRAMPSPSQPALTTPPGDPKVAWTGPLRDVGSSDSAATGETLTGTAPCAGSEERRVGKELVSPCRSGWSPYH